MPTSGSERVERRRDRPTLAEQHAPRASGGAAVHRLQPQPTRLEHGDQCARRPDQRRARAEQDELEMRDQQRFQCRQVQLRQRRRRPAIGTVRRQQQRGIDTAIDAEPAG